MRVLRLKEALAEALAKEVSPDPRRTLTFLLRQMKNEVDAARDRGVTNDQLIVALEGIFKSHDVIVTPRQIRYALWRLPRNPRRPRRTDKGGVAGSPAALARARSVPAFTTERRPMEELL